VHDATFELADALVPLRAPPDETAGSDAGKLPQVKNDSLLQQPRRRVGIPMRPTRWLRHDIIDHAEIQQIVRAQP
jgi:hypothetical protein